MCLSNQWRQIHRKCLLSLELACLTWQVQKVDQNLPYARYVKSYIFVHNAKQTSSIPSPSKNVRIVSLSHIHDSYRQRGFAGLIADMLCQHFNVPKASEHCRTLEERLRTYKPPTSNPQSPITQLRGLWPVIFARWINPELCGAWGWSDLSMMVGDLERWLDHPMGMLNSDVVTIGDTSLWQAYLRSTMTVFSYSKHADVVTSLWKRCPAYASIESLIVTFSKAVNVSLVEGCFSFGVCKCDCCFVVAFFVNCAY